MSLYSLKLFSFKGAANTAYTVTKSDGTPKSCYSDTQGAVPTTNSITTDGNGFGSFYAQGACQLRLGGSVVRDNISIPYEYTGTGGLLSPISGMSEASPEDFPGSSSREKIQAAIDAVAVAGGTVVPKSQSYTVDVPTGSMQAIQCPNNVCFKSKSSSSQTTIKLATGSVGAIFQSYPSTGTASSVGGKHIIEGILFDGNNFGVFNFRCNTTANSATVAGVNSGDFTGLQTGFIYEMDSLPNLTFIQSLNPGAGTITLTQPVTNDPSYTATNQRAVVRPAYTVTGNTDTTTKVLTVTAGSIASVVPGMFALSSDLDSDEDLNANSRVVSVDYVGLTVTIDRVAKNTHVGASITFYVFNVGIWAAEANLYNPSYNSQLEYRAPECYGVMVQNCSGHGVDMRSGRDQFIWSDNCKSVSNFGKGLKLTASNDSKIPGPSGNGVNWEENVCVVSSSTMRLIDFDIFDSRQPSKFFGVNSSGNRQFTMFAGEVNGPLRLRGKGSDEVNHNLYAGCINFKWHIGDGLPDASYPQYCLVNNGAHAMFRDDYFYGDHSTGAAPDRLFQVSDSAVAQWFGSRVITDTSVFNCPFKVEVYATDSGGQMYGQYLDARDGVKEAFYVNMGGRTYTDGIRYTDNATDRRTATEAGNRNVASRQFDQRIAITSNLAAYTVTLPYVDYGNKPCEIRFSGDFSIAALTWKVTLSDGSTATVSSSNFDSNTYQDLPGAISGNTLVRLWASDSTLKWEVVTISGRSNPWVTVASGATITLNANLGSSFYLPLGQNATLANPTGMKYGEVVQLAVVNGGAFSFTGLGGKVKVPGGGGVMAVTASGRDLYEITNMNPVVDEYWLRRVGVAFA